MPVLGGGAGQHSQGHALLAGCTASLKCFAVRAGAAVLVTNHMVSFRAQGAQGWASCGAGKSIWSAACGAVLGNT